MSGACSRQLLNLDANRVVWSYKPSGNVQGDCGYVFCCWVSGCVLASSFLV